MVAMRKADTVNLLGLPERVLLREAIDLTPAVPGPDLLLRDLEQT